MEGERKQSIMDRTQLVTVVAAILTKGTSGQEILEAAKAAEALVDYIQSGQHKSSSDWDGKVKFI